MASLRRPLVTVNICRLHTEVLIWNGGLIVQCAVQTPERDGPRPEGLTVVPN